MRRADHWIRRASVVVGLSFLVALPITGIRAFYQPVDAVGFLSTVLVGLCYGGAYIVTFDWLIPALEARLGPAPLRRWWHPMSSLLGLSISIASGGGVNTWATHQLGISTSQHWWVGGSILLISRLVELDSLALRRKIEQQDHAAEKVRLQATRAELRALQTRVDPHFFFNSLNLLAGLIEEDPPRAVGLVTRLAGLYRSSLDSDRAGSGSLARELDAAATYLEIHSLRFEGKVAYEIDAEKDLHDVQVPRHCLLPLVENAGLHGMSLGRVEIRVSARRNDEDLILSVEDDGPGLADSKHRGSGTALRDLAERLRLESDGRARLTTGDRKPRGFVATITMPFRQQVASESAS
ncbi:MAG: histidine kinase [Thermoanaerobaculia bacterium]|nr:histidine kinase [Thermoanaerobaculia bacterium]